MRFLKWIGLYLLLFSTVTAETSQKSVRNFDSLNIPANQYNLWRNLFDRENPEINLGKLEPTQPREISIESKTRQTLDLSLKFGQLAQVDVLKGDVNLKIEVFAPDGTLLNQLVSAQFGDASIRWIAETEGQYAIQISSLKQSASKTYTLDFLAPRPATIADREFIKYARLFAEGEELFINGNRESLQLALEKYQTAFDGFRLIQNLPEAARSAKRMGEVFLIWGNNKKAEEYFRRAFISSQRGADKLLPISLLNLTGRSLIYSEKLSEARKVIEKVFAAIEKQPDYLERRETLFEEGAANLNIGEILYAEGDLPGSLDKFKYSIQKFEEINDSRGQALGHLFSGYSLSDLGYLEEARVHYQQAFVLSENTLDIKVRALVLTALGGNYSSRGEPRQALKFLNQALSVFHELGDIQDEGITLNGIARVYGELNEPKLAYEIYHQALALFEKNNNRDFQSTNLLVLGLNCRTIGKDEEALTHYRKSFELSKYLGKRRIAAYALSFIAATADAQGKPVNAVEEFRRSLKILESIRDRKGQAETFNSIGDVFYKYGKYPRAGDEYREALKISRTIGDKRLEAQSLYNIALTDRAAGQLEESLKNIDESLSIIENLRVLIANEILRMSYFSMAAKYYNFYINLLMQLHKSAPDKGYDVLAWQASEKVRSRVLLESLSLAGVKIKQAQNSELSLKEERLIRVINDKINLHSNLTKQNKSLEEINKSVQEMRRMFIEYEEIRGEITTESSSADFTSTETSDLARVKEFLQSEPDSILLEYLLTDEKSFLWTITAEKIESYELPPRSEIEKTSREYYEILSAPPPRLNTLAEQPNRVETSAEEFNAKACHLSQMLIPARVLQGDKKRLLIVPDKILNYISFDALPFPCHAETSDQPAATFDYVPLITNYEILITPSASASLILRKRLGNQNTAPNFVAIFADPVFEIGDSRISVGPNKTLVSEEESNGSSEPPAVEGQTENSLSRLIYTSQESEQIMEMTNPAKSLPLNGFDANLSEIKNSRIKDYQILHFATHSLANDEIPELSGIFLSKFNKNGETVPGALRLQDIYNLDINAELIILSSCNSAVGKDVSGEGLISLSRGFMSAGAKSVVGSLWKIDDQATAEMMKYFYTFIIYDKMNLSEALRTAKLKMSEQKKWRSPYFWSGFVLQGEYKNKIVVDNYRKSNFLTIGGLIAVVTLTIIAIFMLRKLINVHNPRKSALPHNNSK
jgi:CHAT domain-containing protein/Tfp pilus assembly protein PilF